MSACTAWATTGSIASSAVLRRITAAIALVLVVAACSPSPQRTSSNTASGARTPSPDDISPNPLISPAPPGLLPNSSSARVNGQSLTTCTGNPGNYDPLAVVRLHGQSSWVLRDYVDEAHPFNVCTIGPQTVVLGFIDAHHLATIDGFSPEVLEIPSGTLYDVNVNALAWAVAPDYSHVLWLSQDAETLHDSWAGHDVVIQRYPPVYGRCGDPDIDSQVMAFTRDYRFAYALWAQNLVDSTYLNVVESHRSVLAIAPPAAGWGPVGGPLMAVWNPATDALYYTQQGDVWSWTETGGANVFSSSLRWIDPTVSPDGQRIAYAVRDAKGHATVHLMDPTTGKTTAAIGAGSRAQPFFLTNDLVWMRSDTKGCGSNAPVSYVYDLRDHAEGRSIIDAVAATWPAASALGG